MGLSKFFLGTSASKKVVSLRLESKTEELLLSLTISTKHSSKSRAESRIKLISLTSMLYVTFQLITTKVKSLKTPKFHEIHVRIFFIGGRNNGRIQ